MTTKVLTAEEITQLKEVQEKRLQLIEQFGIIELRIQEFKLQKEYLVVELKKIRQEETTIGETLQKKYGDGSINLEKGEFISA
jgi:stress response protein YsnF